MFVRTYRIDKIFNSPTLRVQVISDAYLAHIIFAIIAVDLAILTWWQVVSPFVATGALVVSDMSALFVTCASSLNGGNQLFALLVYKVAQTVWGIYLAYSVRDVQDNFNESRFIGISIYNCSIFCLIILPIIYAIQDSRPDMSTLLKGLLAAYISIFTLVCLYGYRFYLLYIGADFIDAGASKNLDPAPAKSVMHSRMIDDGSEIQLDEVTNAESASLRAEVERLSAKVVELRVRLSVYEAVAPPRAALL
jgi:hypothetical protein